MKYFSVKSAGVALCASFSMAIPVNCFGFEVNYFSSSWLNNQIEKHPDIISENESMNAVFSKAEGNKLPLYNPELTTGYEREGTANNFTIGINQTIDLWDKKDVRQTQGNYQLTAASRRFSYTVEEKTAQALQALINWQSAQNRAKLAFEQEKQLEVLLKIVTERQETGDLGQVDAELIFLNLSQLLSKTAQIQVQLKRTKTQVQELLPDWTPETQVYPEQGLGVINFQVSPQWISQHSLVSNKSYLDRWTKIMRGRSESSAHLLQKQWKVGYLNTSDYLLALQQRAEGLYAGIELQT